MKIIIYQNDIGGVAISYPTPDALTLFTLADIAKRTVPAGKPYKVVELNDLPLDGTFNELGLPNIDKTFRSQWTVDEQDLTDGVGEA